MSVQKLKLLKLENFNQWWNQLRKRKKFGRKIVQMARGGAPNIKNSKFVYLAPHQLKNGTQLCIGVIFDNRPCIYFNVILNYQWIWNN